MNFTSVKVNLGDMLARMEGSLKSHQDNLFSLIKEELGQKVETEIWMTMSNSAGGGGGDGLPAGAEGLSAQLQNHPAGHGRGQGRLGDRGQA